MLLFFFLLLLPAEVNTINESTEILHLSPAVTTEYVGEKPEKKAEFCDRSCEELGTMFTELTGLRIVVNNLADNLQKVVGTERDLLCSALSLFVFYQRQLMEFSVCTFMYLLVYLHNVEMTYVFNVTG